MARFGAVYDLPIVAVSSLYVKNRAAGSLRAPLEWSPSRSYTGIVIYAEGELPVHGERLAARLRPCLFPRVFDEGMELLAGRTLVDPEALRSGGVLGYARALDGPAAARVGDSPLRITARAVFGSGRTDLVVSREDALRILSRPENRELVRLGRILVILPPGE
jgi:hypothetical protein